MAAMMVLGVALFVTGVIVGARLDKVVGWLTGGRKDPMEGKNGLLSYRNLRHRYADTEDDDD